MICLSECAIISRYPLLDKKVPYKEQYYALRIKMLYLYTLTCRAQIEKHVVRNRAWPRRNVECRISLISIFTIDSSGETAAALPF
jgi:hypothetical protein